MRRRSCGLFYVSDRSICHAGSGARARVRRVLRESYAGERVEAAGVSRATTPAAAWHRRDAPSRAADRLRLDLLQRRVREQQLLDAGVALERDRHLLVRRRRSRSSRRCRRRSGRVARGRRGRTPARMASAAAARCPATSRRWKARRCVRVPGHRCLAARRLRHGDQLLRYVLQEARRRVVRRHAHVMSTERAHQVQPLLRARDADVGRGGAPPPSAPGRRRSGCAAAGPPPARR